MPMCDFDDQMPSIPANC